MNRTHRSANAALMAVLFVMFLVLSATGLSVARVSADTRSLVSQADESPCVALVDKWARPETVLLGETVDVTITMRPFCAGERLPLHIVLVLDGSGTMTGTPAAQMRQAAAALARHLDLDAYPDTKIGVVVFSDTARTLSNLTNEERRVIAAINRVGAWGASDFVAGIHEGSRAMRAGRLDGDSVNEVMVLFSDGITDDCASVLQAAQQAKSQGNLLIAVCVGPHCEETCMRQLASNTQHYFRAESTAGLHELFDDIRSRILNITVKRLSVRETLSGTLTFVAGSATPRQKEPDLPTDWLLWEKWYVSKEGVTFTYRTKPVTVGHLPVGASTSGTLVDSKDRERSFTFPVPRITVLRPGALQTPDWAVTPTPSTTPTLTPTATVTPTPTASPTPRPRPLYLPCLLDESVW